MKKSFYDNFHSNANSPAEAMEQVAARFALDDNNFTWNKCESYEEYGELVKPLYEAAGDEMANAAIGYIAYFWYVQGLRDGVEIKEKLFRERR
jgi:hypothetical protein